MIDTKVLKIKEAKMKEWYQNNNQSKNKNILRWGMVKISHSEIAVRNEADG